MAYSYNIITFSSKITTLISRYSLYYFILQIPRFFLPRSDPIHHCAKLQILSVLLLKQTNSSVCLEITFPLWLAVQMVLVLWDQVLRHLPLKVWSPKQWWWMKFPEQIKLGVKAKNCIMAGSLGEGNLCLISPVHIWASDPGDSFWLEQREFTRYSSRVCRSEVCVISCSSWETNQEACSLLSQFSSLCVPPKFWFQASSVLFLFLSLTECLQMETQYIIYM